MSAAAANVGEGLNLLPERIDLVGNEHPHKFAAAYHVGCKVVDEAGH